MTKDEAEALAKRIIEANDGVLAGGKLKQAVVEMQVHRAATGLTEDYGIVSGYHSNPFKNILMQLGIKYRNIKRRIFNGYSPN